MNSPSITSGDKIDKSFCGWNENVKLINLDSELVGLIIVFIFDLPSSLYRTVI